MFGKDKKRVLIVFGKPGILNTFTDCTEKNALDVIEKRMKEGYSVTKISRYEGEMPLAFYKQQLGIE